MLYTVGISVVHVQYDDFSKQNKVISRRVHFQGEMIVHGHNRIEDMFWKPYEYHLNNTSISSRREMKVNVKQFDLK